ncbi:ABC transporter ATP-binding protein [Novosphingobium pentaromativorans]|uniref:ATP-binding protein, ABC-type hydroxamate-dependent iron transport system n=1 Tax=Novosphingobium pentaromativorans US6-1 TaxID=1088721 RepID=G6EHK0_9SPHN|nr:ATP-binding cassette domain-containing protein [Novosphingobium pentaromativorans]AIT78501.1 iron-hydroxamate transporter ATP-binding subunit [Novosphingobium pentaromativorans US6-1]EHJ59227.1 ATP-binding protein, ABC-type hydroxamate-dependent iron transport system [Novosphingobium pentaromativorans US6-1]
MNGSTTGMTLAGLQFAVEGKILLHPLTLDIGRQGVTGIIGQNGSGKSTLLRLLARQQPSSGGTIYYDGRDVVDWSDRAFARAVGYLPQHVPITTRLTVRELVAFGRYPWHGAFRRFGEGDGLKVEEALHLTGMVGLADRFLETLSGGERQRAWLAMLVAQEARLLLLDEPIAALDVGHQIEVLSLLRQLSEAHRVASVVVIHEINMAARFCDRIIALREGELVADATPDDLLTPDSLNAIYGIPMGVTPLPEGRGRFAFPVTIG